MVYNTINIQELYDINDVQLKNGDIIDIHQTVNGQSKFVVFISSDIINARYYEINMFYEYSILGLLEYERYDKEIEIIGNVSNNKKYWNDLLKDMIKNKISLIDVVWPKDFLNGNILKSTKSLVKFNL